jgi:hypothetical protein
LVFVTPNLWIPIGLLAEHRLSANDRSRDESAWSTLVSFTVSSPSPLAFQNATPATKDGKIKTITVTFDEALDGAIAAWDG